MSPEEIETRLAKLPEEILGMEKGLREDRVTILRLRQQQPGLVGPAAERVAGEIRALDVTIRQRDGFLFRKHLEALRLEAARASPLEATLIELDEALRNLADSEADRSEALRVWAACKSESAHERVFEADRAVKEAHAEAMRLDAEAAKLHQQACKPGREGPGQKG